jgi:hypothetical protein
MHEAFDGGPSNRQEPEARRIGAGIESLFRPNINAALVEAPGSQSCPLPPRHPGALPCAIGPCRHSP